MLPIQPPLIPAYFSKSNTSLRKSQKLHSQFFLSWEDGLWHLLQKHSIAKDSVVLVPDFFCWDVVENMESHGLKHKTYAVTKQLQPNTASFIKAIKQYNPMVVVIFHAVGMTNSLFNNPKEWLKHLPKDCLLIEDCVHKVVLPTDLTFICPQHYVMDSLRKVVPIQGSWLWTQAQQPFVSTQNLARNTLGTHWYHFQIMFWWLAMQFFLVIAYYSRHTTIGKTANQCAEWSMKVGYDIIGDNSEPSGGASSMIWLWNRLNIPKIKAEKTKQAHVYQQLLDQALKKQLTNQAFFTFSIPKQDYSELRGYPLGIQIDAADETLRKLREKGLVTRFELNDSPWSMRYKVIYLPIGLHVKRSDIEWVCKVVEECATHSVQ